MKRSLLPGYYSSLQDQMAKQRYSEKLKVLDEVDPYEIPRESWYDDVDLWPSITQIHVGLYLLLTPSPYTNKDLQNYKSMDCYINFISGWVREMLVKRIGANRLVIAKVNHSQKMSLKSLTPWILAEEKGKVITAHCDCMAGLGETCSHVASLLWAIEAGVRTRDSMTVTQKSAYWVIPTVVKDIPYAPIRKINFIGRKGSQTQLTTLQSHSNSARSPSPSIVKTVPDPTDKEVRTLFDSLAACESKPAVLSLIEPYSSSYIPKSLDEGLPKSLSCLFNPDHLNMNYSELLQHAKANPITVTSAEAKVVEEKTRDQAMSRLWFRIRSGRITASKFKAVCSTDLELPSFSLIMAICHPETTKFKTAVTGWGCDHEAEARSKYKNMMSRVHKDFQVTDCGFCINPDYPYLGASPDGVITCSCCRDGICEIECPYCHKDQTIVSSLEDKSFCLEELPNGDCALRRSHAYYYQVQCQLLCTQKSFCDFIVWTKHDIHIERVYPEKKFWKSNVSKARLFFERAVMPELTGRFFSRPSDVKKSPPVTEEGASGVGAITSCSVVEPTENADGGDDSHTDKEKRFCYCQGPDEGDMVGCDNPDCTYEWFHLNCLGFDSAPRSKFWHCPDCRKLPQFRRRKTAKL